MEANAGFMLVQCFYFRHPESNVDLVSVDSYFMDTFPQIN